MHFQPRTLILMGRHHPHHPHNNGRRRHYSNGRLVVRVASFMVVAFALCVSNNFQLISSSSIFVREDEGQEAHKFDPSTIVLPSSSSRSITGIHNTNNNTNCSSIRDFPRVVFLKDIQFTTVKAAVPPTTSSSLSSSNNQSFSLRNCEKRSLDAEASSSKAYYYSRSPSLMTMIHDEDKRIIEEGHNAQQYNNHKQAIGNDGFGDDCFWNEWQTAHRPTCNDAHALSMSELVVAGSGILEELGEFASDLDPTADMLVSKKLQQQEAAGKGTGLLAFASGGRRIAGLLSTFIDELDGQAEGRAQSLLLVYKAQRLDRYNMSYYQLSSAHTEAIISDRYFETTTRIFNHCGLFSLTERGSNFVQAVRDVRLDPLQKLSFAVQLAQAIDTLHNRQSTPVIYQDFSEGNLVLVDGQVKLIDFDRALMVPERRRQQGEDHNAQMSRHAADYGHNTTQKYHDPLSTTTTSWCYPHTVRFFKEVDTMSLEWINLQRDLTTEKIDVYGLGSMFFYLLTDGARMYHCEIPKGVCNYYFKNNNTISEDQILAQKENGTLPTLPTGVQTSEDPAIRAIRETMNHALQKHPLERPTAQEIFQTLERACEELNCPSRVYTSLPTPPPSIGCGLLLTSTNQSNTVMEPVYVASYPGSGSSLTLNLIREFTGIKTINRGGRCCNPPELPYNYSARNIHYPGCCQHGFRHGLLSNVIVAIRCPLTALPSKANRQYEADQGLHSYSQQSPEVYWNKWRDEKFDGELNLWEKTIEYWHDSYSNSSRMTVTYEFLVRNRDSGTLISSQLGQFLTRTGAIHQKNASEVTLEMSGCVWDKIGVRAAAAGNQTSGRREKSYKPTFTSEQYHSILKSLQRLLRKYKEESLGPALLLYENTVMAEVKQILHERA